jgi:hypothetical protein
VPVLSQVRPPRAAALPRRLRDQRRARLGLRPLAFIGRDSARAADAAHVPGTPTFTLRDGDRERRLRLVENIAAALEAALDRLAGP